MKNFLWNGSTDGKKYHLVAWEKVCRPKSKGGLGIRNLKDINFALMGKWLWRFGEDRDSLCKYGSSPGGWETNGVTTSYGLSVWRGILRVMDKLLNHIRCKIGNGDRVLFWEDTW